MTAIMKWLISARLAQGRMRSDDGSMSGPWWDNSYVMVRLCPQIMYPNFGFWSSSKVSHLQFLLGMGLTCKETLTSTRVTVGKTAMAMHQPILEFFDNFGQFSVKIPIKMRIVVISFGQTSR